MVELQIVILAVAGSSPVGHPFRQEAVHVRRLIVRYPELAGTRLILRHLQIGKWNPREVSTCPVKTTCPNPIDIP